MCDRCEKGVMSSVNVRNCIRFYQTAEELNAATLMNYCGEIIASHWVRTSSTTHQLRFSLQIRFRFRFLIQVLSYICKGQRFYIFEVIFMTLT